MMISFKYIYALLIITTGIICTKFYYHWGGLPNQHYKQRATLRHEDFKGYKEILTGNNSRVNVFGEDKQQTSRISNINAVCKANPYIRQIKARLQENYYPRESLYYCHVPKLGSTFLKSVFNNTLHDETELVVPQPRRYENSNLYYLNVGEPYTRLFSAYKDKLYRPIAQFWGTLGKNIASRVRRGKPNRFNGFDLTFAELVQYVVELHEAGQTMNVHLAPIHTLCNPCTTPFNFVSRQESLSEDVKVLIYRLNSTRKDGDKIPASVLDEIVKPDSIWRSVEKIEGTVKEYPQFSKHDLYLRHWSMFQMSGHVLKKYDMPFNKSISETISGDEYKETLKNAIELSEREDLSGELMSQRYESMVEAYRSVPMPLMNRLVEYVKTDCLLFSYDEKPNFLFNRSEYYNPTHTYLKGL